MLTPEEKMSRARAMLVVDQPFFGTLALRLKVTEASWVETMATDGVSLFYNPEWIETLSAQELKAIVGHEIMHLACQHHTRRGHRDPNDWNVAGDYAINGPLVQAGFKLPEGMLYDKELSDLPAEAIYERIHRRESEDSTCNDGEPDNSGGTDDTQEQNADGESQDGRQPNQEGSGDGQSDQPGPGDGRPIPSDRGGCGAVMDAPAPEGKEKAEPADLAQAAEEWKIAMAQAAQVAKAAGCLPAGVERLVEQELEPKADWRELLRRFMDQWAKDDYSWSPPNRRFVHQGLYLPSQRSEKMPPMVLAIDTSGSISEQLLDQFAAELNEILEELKPETLHVIYCDAAVKNTQEIEPDDYPVELQPYGGGGTLFRPVFDWVNRNDIDPACLVYLTDMASFDTPEEPDYPVLWADYAGLGLNQRFGEHIVIDMDG